MNQRGDRPQWSSDPIHQARQLKGNLRPAVQILDNLIRECESLQEQVSQYVQQLQVTNEELQRSRNAHEDAKKTAVDWERRARKAEQEQSNTRDRALRDILEKLGKNQVLSHLETIIRSAEAEMAAADQAEPNAGVTLRTLRTALDNFIYSISSGKVMPIFEHEVETIDRNNSVGLAEFEPRNPFSDEFPQAQCRVVSPGWKIVWPGERPDLIIEKARLEPIKSLPAQMHQNEPNPERSADDTVLQRSDSDAPVVNLASDPQETQESMPPSGEQSTNADSVIEPQSPIGTPANQEATPSESSLKEKLDRATKKLDKSLKTPRQRKLWGQFIEAAGSGGALSEEDRAALASWNGDKKDFYRQICFTLNDESEVRQIVEESWKQLVGDPNNDRK